MKRSSPLIFYLVALSLVALSSTLAYLLARRGLEGRENDARVVNLAGRQRMLSQRIAKDCLLLQGHPPGGQARQDVLASLGHSLQDWQQAYLQLRGQQPIGEFTVQNSPEVDNLFDSTEQSFQLIKHAALQILAAGGEGSTVALGTILENEPLFLANMDEIVLRYQIESATKIKQLGRLETFIWLFTLLLLGLELFFIFLPLHRRIRHAIREKNQQNELLLEKQQALESSMARMQQMQQSLVEAEKLATLGETVGVIAHEINTPIGIAVTAASSLQEYTQRLATQFEQQQLRKSTLEAYVGQAQKGSGLVLANLEKAARLLQDYKNVAVSQLSGQRELFDLSELIRQVANTLGPYFKNTEIELKLELPERLEVDSRPGAFAQVLTNLVTNSLRHGFPGEVKKGAITIRLATTPGELILQYSDNGTGIHPDLLPRIFEPFFSTGRRQGGSGLGLSIVQNLVVKQLGGSIACKSGTGEGVLFEICVPID